MLSPDILFKNKLIFIDPARWMTTMITRVITLLIKNKNFLNIYLFEFNVKDGFPQYFIAKLISSYGLTQILPSFYFLKYELFY